MLSDAQLDLVRSNGQYTELYMAVINPVVVYQARVNQTFTSKDSVAQVTYDGGVGNLANVFPDMTMYIGSSAGAYDKGMVRIRKTPTASVFFIGEESEINWADDDYLTIVREFGIWPKHWRVYADNTFMDWDITYSDQHKNCDPVPIIGPDNLLWLSGPEAIFTPHATGSYCEGSTITSYQWYVSGSSWASGTSTANPIIAYNATNNHLFGCTVTAANGKSFTGYRDIVIHNESSHPIKNFKLDSCSGEWESGGWGFKVTMYDRSKFSDIRDRAKVILFARDWYKGDEQSVGPISGYERVIAIGWINGSSIHWSPNLNSVEFDVRGPNFWIDKISGFPAGIEDMSFADNGGGDPKTWLQMKELTVDKGVWSFLHWRTTATRCIDVRLSGDTRYTSTVGEGQAGSLWKQLDTASNAQILAKAACNRYAQLFIRVDPQYVLIADRTSIPVIHPIDKMDWRNEVTFTMKMVDPVGLLEASGIIWTPGTKTGSATPLFSRSPGNVFGRYGSMTSKENLLLSSQAQLNELTGLLRNQMNLDYPSIQVPFRGNDRSFDIVPEQYMTITCDASENSRGISLTNQKIVPRRVSYTYNPSSGLLFVDADFEQATEADLSVTVIKPITPTQNIPPQPDTEDDPIDPGSNPTNSNPVIPVPVVCDNALDAPPNGPFELFISKCVYSSDYGNSLTDNNTVSQYYPCEFRGPAHTNKTYYQLSGLFQTGNTVGSSFNPDGDSIAGVMSTVKDDFYSVDGLNSDGEVVAKGVPDALGSDINVRTGKFDNAAPVDVEYIRLTVNKPNVQSNFLTGSYGFGVTWGYGSDLIYDLFSQDDDNKYYKKGTIDTKGTVGDFVGQIMQAWMRVSFMAPTGNVWQTGSYHITGYGNFSDIDTYNPACIFCAPSDDCRPEFHWYVDVGNEEAALGIGGSALYLTSGTSAYFDVTFEIDTAMRLLAPVSIEANWMAGEGPLGVRRDTTFNGWAKLEYLVNDARVCIDKIEIGNVCKVL